MAPVFPTTLIITIVLVSSNCCLANLNLTKEWKYIDYVWESNEHKAAAIQDGTYDYQTIIPIDVQPLSDRRVLITTPKVANNPASLSVISEESGDGGPLLSPYPSWSWHSTKDCAGITSVERVRLDDYDRLWLVDSGRIGQEQVCPPKIMVFDTTTDKLIIEKIIPEELTYNSDKKQGRLEIAAMETSGEDNFWMYISDLDAYGLLIWNGEKIWRLEDEIYNPVENGSVFTLGGKNVTMYVGLSSALITPDGYLEEPAMLFKPMSSKDAYSVSLEDLHNSYSGSAITYHRTNFSVPTQELARVYTKKGGTIMAGFTISAIACWNLQWPLREDNIEWLDATAANYDFVSGVKSIQYADREKVYVLSTDIQNYLLDEMDWSVSNYKLMTGDVETLLAGTVCEPLEEGEYEVVETMSEKNFLVFKTSEDDLVGSYDFSWS